MPKNCDYGYISSTFWLHSVAMNERTNLETSFQLREFNVLISAIELLFEI